MYQPAFKNILYTTKKTTTQVYIMYL